MRAETAEAGLQTERATITTGGTAEMRSHEPTSVLIGKMQTGKVHVMTSIEEMIVCA